MLIALLLSGCKKRPECTRAAVREADMGVTYLIRLFVEEYDEATNEKQRRSLTESTIKKIKKTNTPECFDRAELAIISAIESRLAMDADYVFDVMRKEAEEDMYFYETRYKEEIDRLMECAPYCD